MSAFIALYHAQRRPRQFRERTRPLDFYIDGELISRYRLPQQGILDLIQLVKPDVNPICERSHSLNATTKKHLLCHPRHLSSVVDEHHFMNQSFSQFRTLKTLKSLPRSLPVTIMTGNYYDEMMPGPLNKAWAKSEQNLINSLYPQGQHIVINGGDRHMMYKNPQAIIEPIRKAIKHWRNKNSNVKAS